MIAPVWVLSPFVLFFLGLSHPRITLKLFWGIDADNKGNYVGCMTQADLAYFSLQIPFRSNLIAQETIRCYPDQFVAHFTAFEDLLPRKQNPTDSMLRY